MSVKQSLNALSQMRIDVPHLRSIDSSVVFDFKTLIQFFTGNSPYILQGLNIINSGIGGPATSLQLSVDGAAIWLPNDGNGSFLKVASGTPNEVLSTSNSKVIGSFLPGANYVGIQFVRATDSTTADLVSFWDVDSQSEFTQTVPLGLVLNYQIVISNTDFGTTCPIAIVNVTGSNVSSIENCRNSLFRLGSGGASPNPNNEWSYSTPVETSLTVTSSATADISGGDWEIKTFKNWMDAVMTRLKQIDGSAYWYTTAGSAPNGLSLSHTWFDTAGSVFTGSGKFSHDLINAGELTWTEDLHIKSIIGTIDLTIDTSASPITMTDQDVVYVTLVRDQDFQPGNTFTFTNGSKTVNAIVSVSGIVAGDWIKLNTDNALCWAQVASVVGSTVTLNTAYVGSSSSGKALRTQGNYVMQKSSPKNMPNSADVYWVGKRDDGSFSRAVLTAAVRTSNVITYTTATTHNFILGDDVVVSGVTPTDFNGTFSIASLIDGTQFTVNSVGPDSAATSFGEAVSSDVITAASRTSDIVTFTFATTHTFAAGNVIIVTGMTPSSFNGNFTVTGNPAPNQITVSQSGNDEVATGFGLAAPAAIIYLKNFGPLFQGEERQVSNTVSNDTIAYIGATSVNDTTPNYNSTATGSLVLPNYNSDPGENLTKRLSKVTAMLADINQNFNIVIDPGNITWDGTTLTTSGASISIPGLLGAMLINDYSDVLPLDSAVYVDISRSSAVTYTLASAAISDLTPAQQRLIVARNIGNFLLIRD
jgi:hypothetical protein